MVFLPPGCEPFLMLAFFAGMFFDNLVWLPRVTARRRAAELADDFAGASRRHRRERWLCWFGLLAGGSVGMITTLQAFFAR